MKTRNWLNLSEYALLVGAGIGSLASVASQQILFTAAPVSALLLVNLVNRRRLEEATLTHTEVSVAQLDQKLSEDLGSLRQQIQVLPNFLDLASLRKSVLHETAEGTAGLSQDITQLKRELAKPEWRLLAQEVRQLQSNYTDLADSVNAVTTYLGRLGTIDHVDDLDSALNQVKAELSQLRGSLQKLGEEQQSNNPRVMQDQINHINRRLNTLPTPFDASALKQDVDSLVKVLGEMVSRRELTRLMAQVEQISQQQEVLDQSVMPIKMATTILKKQLETVTTKLNLSEEGFGAILEGGLLQPDPSIVEGLKATIGALEHRLNQLPIATDLTHLRSDVQSMVTTQVGQLQQQLAGVQQFTQTLDHQQKTLRDWVNRLPHVLDSTALESQVKYLSARVEWAESNAVDVESQVDAAVKSHLEDFAQQLQATDAPTYELVFDVKGSQPQPRHGEATTGYSRKLLEQALDGAQARLIVVHPYPSSQMLDEALIQKFREFLDRSGCLDLGWGHLGDISQGRKPRSIDRRRSLDPTKKGFLYKTLNQLTQLKRQYPDQFRFKVLGTDENFLVCDRSYAVLGTQSVATASAVFPQAAVGLRTTDSAVIQGLVDRFDNPSLAADDVIAYFNRAATRYDLGDRQGAITDYTEVLRIHPQDDVAYNNRGLARYDQNDRHGAMADFEQAVQHNPENFMAHCNRGFVRSEQGDKMGAIEDYTFAIQINPDFATAYFYRGLARTRLQNKLGAIQDYTEVIRLNPQDATAYFYRGLACIKLGHRLDAIEDLRQAAQLFSEQGDTANYQQTLSTIKKLHKTLAIATSSQPLVASKA
ncbi:MAG: tetratricopeptide repeat protein [Verrucomicrobia bacterium]|nr:tetratricopeptide repeat protein [Leptolyngbya sp. ES-bin-22]